MIYMMDQWGGLLYDKYKTPGHGRKYYQEQGNDVMEMIANIGTFYNNNCMDILIYEFGEELASELIIIYKEFLDRSQKLVELQQKVEMNRMLNSQSDNKSNVSTETKGNIYQLIPKIFLIKTKSINKKKIRKRIITTNN